MKLVRRRQSLAGLVGGIGAAALLDVGAAATFGAGLAGCRRKIDSRTATLWFSYGGKNREVLLGLIDQFHAQQDQYRIHATYQGDYFEGLAKLRTAIHADVAPALTHVIGEVVPYLVEAGTLDAMDPYEPLSDLHLVPALSQSGCFVGGADRPTYALPFNRSTPIAYLNGDVLNEIGLGAPTDWEEWRAFAKAATIRTASGEVTRWGFECPVDWWFWVAMVGQAGGTLIEGDGTPVLGGAAGVKALEFWQTLVHHDRTMRPPPGRDYNAWQVTNTDFLAGRAAMIWTSTAFVRYLEDNANFPVVSAPLPRDVASAVPTGGTMFVLPKAGPPEQRDAAVAFLSWMMQGPQANSFATKTGYISVSQTGLEQLETEGYYKAHPNDRVAVDQLKDAVPWPWATELFRIQREIVQPRLEAVVLDGQSPQSVLDDARRAAKR